MKSIIGNFKECVTTKYLRFDGRAGRAEFWQFNLVVVLVQIILLALAYIIMLSAPAHIGDDTVLKVLDAVSLIFNLILFVPTLAVGVRRLHDTGKGGGWLFVLLIPLAGFIWWLVLMVRKGEPVVNRFGWGGDV